MQVQSPNSICSCNQQQVSRFIHISGGGAKEQVYIYIYIQRFPGLVAHLFMQTLLRSLGGLEAQLTTGGILLNEECKAGGRGEEKEKKRRRKCGREREQATMHKQLQERVRDREICCEINW